MVQSKISPFIDVSIILPCLNEEKSLPTCINSAEKALEKLKEYGLQGEIIISDNGSTDGSIVLATKRGCRVVHCPHKGYGYAVIWGMREALGRYLLMGDSDASYDFLDGVEMVLSLHQEKYDVCMGSRFKGKILKGAMPWKNRYLGNPFLTFILNLLFKTKLTDAHCGLRALTNNTFLSLNLTSPGMEFASEMIVKASLINAKISEVPVTLYPDQRGRHSHLRPWRDGWRHLKFLLMLSPLWLFLTPSFFLMSVGAIVFIGLLSISNDQQWTFGQYWIGDHWVILASGAIIVGYGLLLTGITAQIYSARYCMNRSYSSMRKFIGSFKLEHGIIIGVVLSLLGFFLFFHVLYVWRRGFYGELDRIREITLSMTFFVLGIQSIFGSFLISIIAENNTNIVEKIK